MVKNNLLLIALASAMTLSAQAAKPSNEIANLDRDIVALLEKNSTSPREFEDKTIQLGMMEVGEQKELFDRENYRQRKKRRLRAPLEAGPSTDETKSPLSIVRGDYSLMFGGSMKVEHFLEHNQCLLNKNIPDELEFFKHTGDITMSFAYGEKQFGHKAVEAYFDLRHKGYWGRGSVFADSDASNPVAIKLADTYFGKHKHSNGKPLIWFYSAWLSTSLSAVAKSDSKNIHYLQLGWFPFALGRGISLGYAFGLNQSAVSLYHYAEEKAAPGILLTGDLVKDRLTYDLYYSKFEERGKSLADTIAPVRASQPNEPTWRGVGKDNDLVAARLRWKPIQESSFGTMELEPYFLINEASDQSTGESSADAKTQLRTTGLALEHTFKNFEWGGEAAMNFGREMVRALDRNSISITADANGKLQEVYSQIFIADANGKPTATKAVVTSDIKTALSRAANPALTQANTAPVAGGIGNNNSQVVSGAGRFRPSYQNDLRGWMAIADAAYNFPSYKMKLGVAGGLVTGDEDPNNQEITGTYKGFIGLNEIYSGKRVKSIIVLDERNLQRPIIKEDEGGHITASSGMSFSNLKFFGASAVWRPTIGKDKAVTFNPNLMGFWSAHDEWLPIADPADAKKVVASSTEKARTFLGTELNLCTDVELLKDLKLFANFAVFFPGGFFTDMEGIPLADDDFANLVTAEDPAANPADFRTSNNNAYHMNIGLTYKF